VAVLRLLGFFTLAALVLSTIAASPGASFLASLDYPSLVLVMGGTAAVSLISALYGLGLSEFFFVPMQTTALKRAESQEPPGAERGPALFLMLFVILSVGSYGLLLLSMILW
jgi:hypothetical protein